MVEKETEGENHFEKGVENGKLFVMI